MPLYEPTPPERNLVPPSNLPPDVFFLPPPSPGDEEEDNRINLSMGGYSYDGTLTTNWNKRITRLNQLSVTVLRVLYRLMGALNFNVNIIVNLPNPFSQNREDAPQTINYEGFFAITELLKHLHTKVDNLHEDLQNIVPVASVVEHWQLKKEANRPQGILLFGEWEEGAPKIGPPKWQTCIPYFIPGREITYSNEFGYWKGNRQGIVTLSDNSKIIIYARDDDEIDRVFNRVLIDVRTDMKDDLYTKRGDYNGPPFSTRYVRLRRIDYYSTGQLRGPMDDYLWFPAEPDEAT